MNEKQALERLAEIRALGEAEDAHIRADTLVVHALHELGWSEFAKCYEDDRQEWWYA